MGISIRAYARHRGVSDKAVRKAIQTGRIAKAVLPDKSIDSALADRLWEANTDPVQRRGKEADRALQSMAAKAADPTPVSADPGPQSGSAPEPGRSAPSETGSVPKTNRSDNVVEVRLAAHAHANRERQRGRPVDDEDGETSPEMLELAIAEKAEKVRKLRLDNDIREGNFIPAAPAEAHYFALLKAVNESWERWPDRIGTELADRFGVGDVHGFLIALKDYVREHQEELAATDDKEPDDAED